MKYKFKKQNTCTQKSRHVNLQITKTVQWRSIRHSHKVKWHHKITLNYVIEVSLFFNMTPQYTNTFVSSWHSFYIHWSGRSQLFTLSAAFIQCSKCCMKNLSAVWIVCDNSKAVEEASVLLERHDCWQIPAYSFLAINVEMTHIPFTPEQPTKEKTQNKPMKHITLQITLCVIQLQNAVVLTLCEQNADNDSQCV